MDAVFQAFSRALADYQGYAVADTISPVPPKHDAGRLYAFYRSSNVHQVKGDIRYAVNHTVNLSKAEKNAWVDVFTSYWTAIGEILAAEEAENSGRLGDRQFTAVYEAWKAMTNTLIKYHSESILPAWTIPCLYLAGKYLRVFAIRADEQLANSENVTSDSGFQDDMDSIHGKNATLEDAARVLSKIFSTCLSDRAPMEDSKKWGTYYIANLQFKTYFKLNAISLSKNVVRSIQACELPHFSAFPKSHVVTFKYYVGVLAFLQEDYTQANVHLTEAWQLCHKAAKKNQELILTYLIPVQLVTKHELPRVSFLSNFPRLHALFGPLAACIKRGDLAGFDAALAAGENEFVKRRIYLTLERGRDIALRNLLRKVFVAGGFEEPANEGQAEGAKNRRTRIPISEFIAALRLGAGPEGEALEREEVECMIANMIYKNYIKGYISRPHSMVVLSKKNDAFPGTGI